MTNAEQEQIIKTIRQEIFRLALLSPDLETMHWYTALDDCFENDEFCKDDISPIVWRCQVLSWKHQPTNQLVQMIDALFREARYKVESKGDIMEPLIIEEVIND